MLLLRARGREGILMMEWGDGNCLDCCLILEGRVTLPGRGSRAKGRTGSLWRYSWYGRRVGGGKAVVVRKRSSRGIGLTVGMIGLRWEYSETALVGGLAAVRTAAMLGQTRDGLTAWMPE